MATLYTGIYIYNVVTNFNHHYDNNNFCVWSVKQRTKMCMKWRLSHISTQLKWWSNWEKWMANALNKPLLTSNRHRVLMHVIHEMYPFNYCWPWQHIFFTVVLVFWQVATYQNSCTYRKTQPMHPTTNKYYKWLNVAPWPTSSNALTFDGVYWRFLLILHGQLWRIQRALDYAIYGQGSAFDVTHAVIIHVIKLP